MKLSKLVILCNKAIEKYGDIDLGVYPRDDAYDINDGSETYRDLYFRVMLDKELPGEVVEEDNISAPQKDKHEEPTAILFYE